MIRKRRESIAYHPVPKAASKGSPTIPLLATYGYDKFGEFVTNFFVNIFALGTIIILGESW